MLFDERIYELGGFWGIMAGGMCAYDSRNFPSPDAFLTWLPAVPMLALYAVFLAAMVYGWWENE